MKEDLQGWLAPNSIYPGVPDVLRALLDKQELYIVTTKQASVTRPTLLPLCTQRAHTLPVDQASYRRAWRAWLPAIGPRCQRAAAICSWHHVLRSPSAVFLAGAARGKPVFGLRQFGEGPSVVGPPHPLPWHQLASSSALSGRAAARPRWAAAI